jgi:hypothetical protein
MDLNVLLAYPPNSDDPYHTVSRIDLIENCKRVNCVGAIGTPHWDAQAIRSNSQF